MQILFFTAVWYGTGDTSALKKYYPRALDTIYGTSLTINEALLIFVFFAGIALLLSECKLSIPRSRLHIPIILFFATFLIPYMRMAYEEGGFRIPYEVHNLTFFLTYFCVFTIFRTAEYKKLFFGFLVIAVLKAIEGCIGYALLPTASSSWGALTEWRDGYLLGITLISWFVTMAFRKDIPQRMILPINIAFIIVLVGFIVSIRRSFIFALPLASIVTVLTLRGTARRNAFYGILILFAVGLGLSLVISPEHFFNRMEVVENPLDEFSAAYRLFEYKNVLLNVAASPWFGNPMGTPWKIYTVFPFPVLSPLYAHDTYLNILLRDGIFGMALFTLLVAAVIRSIRSCVRNARTAFDRICGASFAGWGTLFILGSATAPLLTDFRASIVIGATAALIGLCDSALSETAAFATAESTEGNTNTV